MVTLLVFLILWLMTCKEVKSQILTLNIDLMVIKEEYGGKSFKLEL